MITAATFCCGVWPSLNYTLFVYWLKKQNNIFICRWGVKSWERCPSAAKDPTGVQYCHHSMFFSVLLLLTEIFIIRWIVGTETQSVGRYSHADCIRTILSMTACLYSIKQSSDCFYFFNRILYIYTFYKWTLIYITFVSLSGDVWFYSHKV